MASRNAQLADAVAAALNSAPPNTFNAAFTAVRVYTPKADPNLLQTLTVSVISDKDNSDRTSRDTNEHELSVLIGIEKKVAGDPASPKANAEIDQLTELVEQISDYFGIATINPSVALFVNSTIRVLCDPPSLLTQKVFRGVVELNFLLAL